MSETFVENLPKHFGPIYSNGATELFDSIKTVSKQHAYVSFYFALSK